MNSQNEKESSGHVKAAIISGVFLLVAALVSGMFLLLNTMFANGIIGFGSSSSNVFQDPNSRQTSAVETSISSRSGWQYTGVDVVRGDFLIVKHFAGEWTGDVHNGQPMIGQSAPWPERTDACLPIKAQGSSLVGRINSGPAFLVGNDYSKRIDSSGRFELRINDCDEWLGDNEGSLSVTIETER